MIFLLASLVAIYIFARLGIFGVNITVLRDEQVGSYEYKLEHDYITIRNFIFFDKCSYRIDDYRVKNKRDKFWRRIFSIRPLMITHYDTENDTKLYESKFFWKR
jgi:hypothetical protein